MSNQPDSALILLRDSVHIGSLNYHDKALYALLLTQACDKNYIDHTSDSLINIAVQYYKYRNNVLRKAQSYFYLGSVYRDINRANDAIEAFLKAKEELPAGYNTRFKDMINRNLAFLYTDLGFYEKGMEMVGENYKACLERGDSIEIVYPLSDLGHFYLYEDKNDSSLIYYHKALEVSKSINDSLMRVSILYGMSQTLYLMEDYFEANNFVEEAIYLSKNKSDSLFYYTMKGDILLSLNMVDSARYFLEKGINSGDIHVAYYCAESLYELEKTLGNSRDAIVYNDLYLALKDSLNEIHRRTDVLELINNHSINVHTNELVTQWKRERVIWIIIVAVAIILLLTFIIKLLHTKKINKQEHAGTINQASKSIIDNLQEAKQLFSDTETYQYMITVNSRSLNEEVNLNSLERKEKREEVAVYFSTIIIELRSKYNLTDDDIYCFILFYLGFSHKAIATFMGVSSDALRSRKKRMRRKLDKELIKILS